VFESKLINKPFCYTPYHLLRRSFPRRREVPATARDADTSSPPPPPPLQLIRHRGELSDSAPARGSSDRGCRASDFSAARVPQTRMPCRVAPCGLGGGSLCAARAEEINPRSPAQNLRRELRASFLFPPFGPFAAAFAGGSREVGPFVVRILGSAGMMIKPSLLISPFCAFVFGLL